MLKLKYAMGVPVAANKVEIALFGATRQAVVSTFLMTVTLL
jgi:hypothetical protein